MRTLIPVLLFLAFACGTEPKDKDAGSDGAIDCSRVGCAAPPPCGEACTAVCGCCTNLSCFDSGTTDAAKDASGDG